MQEEAVAYLKVSGFLDPLVNQTAKQTNAESK